MRREIERCAVTSVLMVLAWLMLLPFFYGVVYLMDFVWTKSGEMNNQQIWGQHDGCAKTDNELQ